MIPGLRPWEVLDVEQIMEKVTYGEKWFREPLSAFTTRADYDEAWFNDYKVCTWMMDVLLNQAAS